jgi:hypothetical protein
MLFLVKECDNVRTAWGDLCGRLAGALVSRRRSLRQSNQLIKVCNQHVTKYLHTSQLSGLIRQM